MKMSTVDISQLMLVMPLLLNVVEAVEKITGH
jgi:hypothetical protein